MANLRERLGDWYIYNHELLNSDYFLSIIDEILKVSKPENILPKRENVFKAFELTSMKDLKVVILGQDPYPNPIYPIGLAFGIDENNLSIPKSLKNIREEVEDDIGFHGPDFDYSLQSWANQGVLLLNTALTVDSGNPESHSEIWKPFTESIISSISKNKNDIVWILWGNKAKYFKKFITNDTHEVIEGAHPSPLSAYRGFFGGKYFSKANKALNKKGINQIEWTKRKSKQL